MHKEGVKRFLEKEIEGLTEEEIKNRNSGSEKQYKRKWLKFNKIFDIKDVNDDESFDDNARVLKEVVALLAQYQIRYPRRQQHLSDFFERLLTTGLKQEAGQYFTPVPITRFIAYSLPLKEMIIQEVNQPNPEPVLPAVIDYAAGSGHFLTEILEMYQNIINELDISDFYRNIQQGVKAWKDNPYSWAEKSIYGIEKDYRLVKVAKVGCYFYGDGLAQVIHGDGLDNFEHSKTYRGRLKNNKNAPQFNIVVSNPPYSVEAFKGDLRNIDAKNDFSLFQYLTDRSSEIECLFVERTAQLLKEGGVAGIILPSSILSNTGIYTKTREILLQKFEIIAMTELGSNTFMATGTNTVVLFLRRRNDDEVARIKEAAYHIAETYPADKKDLTTGGIEKPIEKYFAHTGETDIQPEKLFYFISAYNQTVVLVKTGEKDAEKRFLGYEFSNRRGYEGIHAIERGKTVDKCTHLFDENTSDNPQKASAYIYRAFNGDITSVIDESLQDNVCRTRLVDMLVFDRDKFEKTISTAVKKEQIKSRWNVVEIGNIATAQYGYTDKATDNGEIRYLRITDLNDDGSINSKNEIKYVSPPDDVKQQFSLHNDDIVIARSGSVGKAAIYKSDLYEDMVFASYLIRLEVSKEKIIPEYLFYFTKTQWYWDQVAELSIVLSQPNLNAEKIKQIKIPLPPMDIQEKIVAEIEAVEKQEATVVETIKVYRNKIEAVCSEAQIIFDKKHLKELAITNPSKDEISNIDLETFISFIDMTSVSNDGYIVTKIDKKYGDIKKGSYTYFKEGDIIIAKITPYMENGKCALAYGLTNGIALGSSEFHVIRANDVLINAEYLFYSLNRNEVRTEAAKNMTGASGHRRVPIAFYERLEIPVPSMQDQEKIVVEIEKLEAEIQDLQKQQEQLKNQKEQILKKYL